MKAHARMFRGFKLARWVTVFAAVLALTAALASRADAFVYWANNGSNPGTIGRANNNGAGATQSFISAAGTFPSKVTVDGAHVYWVTDDGTIGRADLDGNPASVDPDFIAVENFGCGVAVDSSHVYWSNSDGTIGRANLNGSGVDQSFIDTGLDPGTTFEFPCSLAVAGGFIYWDNRTAGKIGRAALSDRVPHNNFVTGATEPDGIAVTATHVYWAISDGAAIGRALLSPPRTPDNSFVTGAGGDPCGVAVDATYVYWANAETSPSDIGRAPLADPNGPGKDASFITGADDPCGVAVNALSTPSCQNTSASTALSEPVEVSLSCSTGGGTRTYSVTSSPAHGTLTDFSAQAGTATYIPSGGFRGTDSFTYRARNQGATSNTATATLTVTPNSNAFTIGKPKKNKHKGIAVLPVTVPVPGAIEIPATKSVKRQIVDARSAGEFKIAVRSNGKKKKKLKKKGKVKVPVDVVFSPTGGDQATESLKVKLKRKHRS
jgi:Bacterial Ig domain